MPRAIIAEDEPVLRAGMKRLLTDVWPELDIVATAADGLRRGSHRISTVQTCFSWTSKCRDARDWRSRKPPATDCLRDRI